MAQKQKIYLPTFISSINYDAARVLPHIYFYNGTKACEPYYIENENGTANQFEEFPYFDNYSGNVTTTSSLSLLFNNEAAVYGEAPSASLYSTYWEKYVELLYNPRTRIMNCSAIIPLADYFKMDLNDIVQFRGNHYHLRAINNYNLSNGECDLELLGPILGDVLANILPGVQCQFDFDIEDVYYGWRIQTCDETPVTYEVSFNTTSSIVPGMIISASSEISGCWYISGSVTQSVLDYYNVGVYGTYTSCASCSMTPPPPPSSSFYVSKCDDTAQLTFDFTSSLSMSIGNVFTLPSSYALEGCWYVSSSYSGATDLDNVSISQSFVSCISCSTPPPPPPSNSSWRIANMDCGGGTLNDVGINSNFIGTLDGPSTFPLTSTLYGDVYSPDGILYGTGSTNTIQFNVTTNIAGTGNCAVVRVEINSGERIYETYFTTNPFPSVTGVVINDLDDVYAYVQCYTGPCP
jgi:hypothetical protein